MDHVDSQPLAYLSQELGLLEARESRLRWDPQSSDSMIDWLEQELGLVIRGVPKLHAMVLLILRSLQARERIRVAIVGPRGGGKTMLAAAIQLLSVRFYGTSWTSIGGSLEQASRLFAHARSFLIRSHDLQSFIREALARKITARNGATITVHAASEKSIRGQHPRGPSGAGGIVLDEASLIDDSIIDAAIPQIASANPSIVIQLSTLGEHQSGRFWDLTQNPTERGYQLFEFGVFDVAKRCPFDCDLTCPVPAFAKDQHRETPSGRLQRITKALCAGKAHATDGWIDIDEIAQQHKDLPRGAFLREFLGSTSTQVGAVYNAEDIDRAHVNGYRLALHEEDHWARLRCLEKVIGLDWGFSGETWATYVARIRKVLIVYRWEYWTQTRFSEIREHLVQRIMQDNICRILPDSANPSDNEDLDHMIKKVAEEHWERTGEEIDCTVEPIVFGREKSLGIGEVRRRLEQEQIYFPKTFHGEPILNVDRAVRLLKNYRLDQNGKPAKVDDHCPDSLLCALLHWAPRRKRSEIHRLR